MESTALTLRTTQALARQMSPEQLEAAAADLRSQADSITDPAEAKAVREVERATAEMAMRLREEVAEQ